MKHFIFITLIFSLSTTGVLGQESFGYPVGGTTVHTNCYFNNTCASSTGQKHTGLDFKSINGYPVYATATGKIQSIIPYGQNCNSSGTGCLDHGLGNTVIVAHRLRNGGVIYSQYSHLDQIATGLSVGMVVSKGYQLGIMGATGQNCRTYWCVPSTSACDGSVGCGNTHLHFELKNNAVVGAPNGTNYWGYTPNEASTYGYSDPYTYLTSTTNSTYQVIPHPTLNGYNSSTLTFDWTDVTGATNYRIQVRKANANGWSAENGFTSSSTTNTDVVINTTTGTTSHYITSSNILLPSTTYYWTIRVANSSTSAFYSPVQSFTTPAATTCSFPTNISSSNITSNSARINWTLNTTNTNSITLDWSPNGSVWNTVNLAANYYYYDLTNLSSGTTYYYRLKRNCTTGGSSAYSSTYTFTTTAAANLTVSTTSLSFTSSASTQNVGITSNVSWNASSNASWLTVSPTTGTNNGTISVSCTANTSSTVRTGTITVSGGGITQNITITQQGSSNFCGNTTLTSASGGFNDGSGSNNYNNNTNCSWLIQPAGATSISISFSAFATESGFDYVRIYAGATTSSPLISTYSGSTIPASVMISNPTALVTFTSDASIVAQGWTANYTSTSLLSGGHYKIVRKGTNKAVDVENCWGAGANVRLWDDLNNECQRWLFELQSDGSYEIKRKNTVLNLDAYNCGNLAGTNVWMWNDNNLNCQRWIVLLNQDGSYELKRKGAEHLSLDAQDCGNWTGTNVRLWDDNNLDCQRWIMTYMGSNLSEDGPDDRADIGYDSEQQDKTEDFVIYPNPAQDYFSVFYKRRGDCPDCKIFIRDSNGKLLKSTVLTLHVDSSEQKIDTSDLPGGIYFVEINDHNEVKFRKLIISR